MPQTLLPSGERISMSDQFNLNRFITAQDADGTYERALTELRAGRKRTHWMWFVFPQVAGLGQSSMSQRYAIRSLMEAEAYLRDPLLRERLLACTRAVASLRGLSAEEVFGTVDAAKLRSSMTLLARAAPEESLFPRVLESYFAGVPDPATEALLAGEETTNH